MEISPLDTIPKSMENRTDRENGGKMAGFDAKPRVATTKQAASRVWPSRAGLALLLAGGAAVAWWRMGDIGHAAPAMPVPHVTVSAPLMRSVAARTGFLGQFSAVQSVELRAQVGGILTEIHFTDGQIVHEGDLLFVIDPRPYAIRLEEARATLATAVARMALTTAELWRAQQLKQTSFGTAENVDQRRADQDAAQAAIDQAKATMEDAQLDLEFCHVRAPFSGRISSHRVSIGNLVSGSRGGTSTTTLLTTLVSLDPIYFDFDMSENDFLAYERAHPKREIAGGDDVSIRLGDETHAVHHGKLDFIDNALDRSSGTISARATVPNGDLFIKPGEFARARLTVVPAATAMLVPEAAVMIDQSQHLVLTVAPSGMVVPRPVEVGDTIGGLQVIRAGLQPTDRVIINGLMHAMPGTTVAPDNGTIRFDGADD